MTQHLCGTKEANLNINFKKQLNLIYIFLNKWVILTQNSSLELPLQLSVFLSQLPNSLFFFSLKKIIGLRTLPGSPFHQLIFFSPPSFYRLHCSPFSKYVTIFNHHHGKVVTSFATRPMQPTYGSHPPLQKIKIKILSSSGGQQGVYNII